MIILGYHYLSRRIIRGFITACTSLIASVCRNIIKSGIIRLSTYCISLLLITSHGFSQNYESSIKISGSFINVPFQQFAEEIETKYDIRFFFRKEWIEDIKVNISVDSISLPLFLENILKDSELNFYIDENNDVFITDGKPLNVPIPRQFIEKEKSENNTKKLSVTEQRYLSGRKKRAPEKKRFGIEREVFPNEKLYLSGKITDSESGESVIGATLYIKELKTGVVTDVNGYYRLPIPPGKYQLAISSVGMSEVIYAIEIWENGRLDIEMGTEIISLKEVVVEAKKFHNVRGIQMGVQKIDIKQIKEMPMLMGEVDILAVAKMLPGVQSVGEGSSGFNVRGSPADQNLFYINKVPVYNTSHLFGFFSSFNPDIVKGFTLYKSNIPAKYGGRLASIFDITAREGNKKKYTMKGGISPVTARVAVEGPVIKDKASFLLGGRTTYSDWLLKKVDDPKIRNSGAGFYDITGNFSFEHDKANNIQIFSFISKDRFNFSTDNYYNYQSIGSSVDWRHLFSDRLMSSFTGAFARYSYENIINDIPVYSYSKKYNIKHYELKTDFNYNITPEQLLNFGLSVIYYKLDRGKIIPFGNESLMLQKDLGDESGTESAIYIGDKWEIGPRLTIYGGLRYSLFVNAGKNTVREYLPGFPLNDNNVIDTTQYGFGEIIKSYSGLEWRFAVNYILAENSSVKISVNRLKQYLFMLSNTIAISPTDQWKLSDKYISPQTGDQISAGYYYNSRRGSFELSVEGYYKKIHDVVEYKNGANLIGNRWMETDIVQGEQDAYGVEFLLRKKRGKINGWLSYAYSRSQVVVDGAFPEETINSGKSFPANYDKPHAVNFVGNYRMGRRVSLSCSVIYNTGRPITYPNSLYYLGDREILSYSYRNEYRIPDYFRVDLSLNIEGNLFANKFAHSSWTFAVYNVTGRENAYSVFFKNEEGAIKGYHQSIFGVPIVTLTWNFKLGDYSDD